MLATLKRRQQAEIEKNSELTRELTRVERESQSSFSEEPCKNGRLSTIESTSTIDDDLELLEEPLSDSEDVFGPQ